MANALRELVAKFTIKADHEQLQKLNAGLDGARERVVGLGAASEKLEGLTKGLESINEKLSLIVGYEALKGLYDMSEKFAEMGEQLHNASVAAGLDVEKFQELSFAAKEAGISQEQMTTSISRMSRALYDAQMGSSDAIMAFANLGFSGDQISSMHNGEQAMMALAGRLQHMHDPMEKLALTEKVLGRSSMELVAFLSEGPEALRKKMEAAGNEGLILSKSQVEALERMNKSFERLKQFIVVIEASFAQGFAPVLEHLTNDFIKMYHNNEKWINLNVKNFIYDVGFALGYLDGILEVISEEFKKHLGKKGWLGHILEVISAVGILGTALTGLAAFGGVISLLASGFATLLAPIKLITGFFSSGGAAGAAEAAAGGAAEAIPAAGSVAGLGAAGAGAEAAAGGGILGVFGPLLGLGAAGYGGFKIGDLLLKLFPSLGNIGEKFAGISDAEAMRRGAMMVHPIAAAAGAGGVSHSMTANITVNAPTGADAHSIARHVKDAMHEFHNQKMRETYRAVRGVKGP